MRVKMRSIMAGPEGHADVGQIIDVPDNQGRAMIRAGFAELFGPEVATRPPAGAETASLEAKP